MCVSLFLFFGQGWCKAKIVANELAVKQNLPAVSGSEPESVTAARRVLCPFGNALAQVSFCCPDACCIVRKDLLFWESHRSDVTRGIKPESNRTFCVAMWLIDLVECFRTICAI